MNQIGFKNFRRFKQLQPKQLGDITILVGANNAGKSTLVKGLLLALDNIRSFKVAGVESMFSPKPEFRFDANEYHDLGIGTFGRALCNKAPSKDEIGFSVRLSRDLKLEDEAGNEQKRKADFTITIFVTGDKTIDQTTGTISRIVVLDNTRGIKFEFNYDAHVSRIEFASKKSESSSMKKSLEAKISMLEIEIETLYKESQMLKLQIAERHSGMREEMEREATLHSRQEEFIKQRKELADKMTMIDPASPDAVREMEEINRHLEELRHHQMAIEEQYARERDVRLEDIARLNSLSNSTLMRIADRNAELDKLRKSLEVVSKDAPKEHKSTKIEMPLSMVVDKVGGNFIVNQIEGILTAASFSNVLSDEDKADEAKLEAWQNEESDKAFIQERSGILRELSDDLSFTIGGISAEYIYAHSVSQNILFNTDNKNDYMARAIHRFYREKIVEGTAAHTFVKNWMKEFEIGDNFKIESYGGEAYRFYVYEGKEKMDLADKGMGSNQMMILLLSLASIIRRYEYNYAKPFIIIEEPEQNLHPALQSRLIELLTEVNKKYGFRFIIETHSEYIIRRAQVFVAQDGYKDDKDVRDNCPYTIYYFPKDNDPYLMEFRTDGKFANEFGTGFFDEANNLVFKIL